MQISHRIMTMLMALALFLTAGGHWATLQGVAWATMVHDFSRTGSLTEAVEKTFDGQHPCPLCKKIASARGQEERQEGSKSPSSVKVEKKADPYLFADSWLVPLPLTGTMVYGPSPFVRIPELLFAPPIPVPRATVS